MTPLFVLSQIRYTYPGATTPLLDSVDLQVFRDSKIGLFGNNGTGKSTLFHISTGLTAPHAGTVFFQSKALIKEQDFRAARLSIGYLLQKSQDQLFCATVREDVAFGPLNQGDSPAKAAKIADDTLVSLHISHLADRAGCNLSGGEQKLAALATILAMRPKLFLLDEPTNDLDTATQERLERFLQETSIPFLLVSHDKEVLFRNCSQLFTLYNGKILPYKKM